MPKLTAKFIENEVQFPAQGQVILRDDDLKGFGLRVSPNCISYIVECRVDGKVKRTTLGRHGFITAEEARKEAQKMLTGIAFAKHSVSIVTLNQILEEFLASRSLRPNTVASYSNITRRCLAEWLDLPITSITKEMVLSRQRELTRTTKQGSSGGEVQANMSMRILRTLLNYAANNYETSNGQPIILVNPVKKLSQNRSWHREPRRRVVIPDHKLGNFYRAVMSFKNRMIRDYLLLLLLTGLRRNEAANLGWSDVDLIERKLTVPAEFAKNKLEHSLPLSDFLFLLLSKRKEDPRKSEFVFPGRDVDKHMVDSGIVIAQVVEKTCCDVVLHDLRRYS